MPKRRSRTVQLLAGLGMLVILGSAVVLLWDSGQTPEAADGVAMSPGDESGPRLTRAPAPLGGGSAEPLAGEGNDHEQASPDVASPESVVSAPAPAASVGVHGRVVDPDGMPLSGVTVLFMPGAARCEAILGVPFDGGRCDVALLPSTTSGHDGRFDLEVPAGDEPAGPSWPAAPDLAFMGAGLAVRTLPCKGLVSTPLDLGDVLLEPGGQLTGRVLDEHRRPVAGLPVEILCRRPAPRHVDNPYRGSLELLLATTTSADGRFLSPGLWPGPTGFGLEAPGFVPVWTHEHESLPGELTDVGDVVLSRGALLAGLVVDGAGAPVADAKVHAGDRDMATAFVGFMPADPMGWELSMAREDGAFAHAVTDRAGGFVVEGLSGGSLAVYAEAPGYEPGKTVGVEPGDEQVIVELQAPAQLMVTLTEGPGGPPVSGAEVAAWRQGFEVDEPLVVEPSSSGVPGTYEVIGVGAGENRLRVSAPGRATVDVLTPGVAAPARARLDVPLSAAASFALRAVDAAGTPLPGARLALRPLGDGVQLAAPALLTGDASSPPARRIGIEGAATSSASGEARLDAMAGGRWWASLTLDDRAPWELEVTIEDGASLHLGDVVLAAGANLAGQVLDRRGAPLLAFALVAEPDGVAQTPADAPSPVRPLRTDADGRFVLAAVPAGRWSLRGDRQLETVVTLEAGVTTEVTLTVPDKPALHGVVTAAGLPVVGAGVFVREDGEQVIWGRMIADRTDHTDDQGRYGLTLVKAMDHRVQVSTEDGAWLRAAVPLAWDEDRRLDLDFGAAVLAGVVVRASDGSPVVDARVSCVPADGNGQRSGGRVTTAADGRFAAGRLLAGSYTLKVQVEGFAPLTTPLIELADGERRGDLSLEVTAGASLSGEVRRPGFDVVPDDMDVQLVRRDSGEQVSLTATTAGAYRFDGVAAGAYLLRVAEPSEISWRETTSFLIEEPVELAPGEQRRFDVMLPEG